MVQPVKAVHVPAASHVTVDGLAVPSYPTAQDTDDVSPYVVPVVLENVYPVASGVPQPMKNENVQSNFNGSNTFGTMKISSRPLGP